MNRIAASRPARTGRWRARHTVLGVLFITWLVAFMDRTVMSVAIPYIAADFKLSPWQSGLVMGVFFASYSISQIPGGILADIFGVRRVATVAM
jgi:MFS family permease